MTTLREELTKFANELKDYAALPIEEGNISAAARADVCRAHFIRVQRILALSDYDVTTYAVATFGPGDAAVVVSVPSGSAPTLVRFDRTESLDTFNARDLLLTCTLLGHALGLAREAYAKVRYGDDAKLPQYSQQPLPGSAF